MATAIRAALKPGTATTKAPKVLIVGAGFAGLAAAKKLLAKTNNQCNIVILEADNQVGGRARTLELGNTGVGFELGATWIHGLGSEENPNPVLKAAMEANIFKERPDALEWWNSTYVLPGRSEPLTKIEELLIHTTVESYRGVIEGLSIKDQGSVTDHLNQALKEVLDGTNSEEERNIALAAWQWRDGLQAAISGSPSSDQDAAGLAMYTEFAGHEAHAAVPGGFQRVAEALADGLDIRLGHQVDQIQWDNYRKVSLQCNNGEEFNADAAVVTVSLGVLKKKYGTLFEPAIPPQKVAAIKKLKIGLVDKICIDFSTPIAADNEASTTDGDNNKKHPDESSVDIVYDAGPLTSYSLLWTNTSSSTQNQDDFNTTAAAATANNQTDSESSIPDWARGIYAIRFGGPELKVPPKNKAQGRKHLVIWITGKEALQMERASDEEILHGIKAVFNNFPGLQLPEGASWRQAKVYRSDWSLNPHTHGSYSYIACGSSPVDVENLKAPLVATSWTGQARPVVAFAGEACSVKYIGAVHGAILTGEEAADVVIESLQSVNKLDKDTTAMA